MIKNVLETEQDFLRWKKNVEEACDIKWVKQAAKKKASGCTVVTYICHRSGKFRSSGARRRALKSCKIGHFCTAYLKVVILEEGKGYQVELYPDHYGHDVSTSEDKKVKVQVGLASVLLRNDFLLEWCDCCFRFASVSTLPCIKCYYIFFVQI